MEFQIEKNSPIPGRKKGWGKWQKVIEEMDLGDAVILEDDENLTAYHGLRRAGMGMGFKISMRTLEDGKIKAWKQEALTAIAE